MYFYAPECLQLLFIYILNYINIWCRLIDIDIAGHKYFFSCEPYSFNWWLIFSLTVSFIWVNVPITSNFRLRKTVTIGFMTAQNKPSLVLLCYPSLKLASQQNFSLDNEIESIHFSFTKHAEPHILVKTSVQWVFLSKYTWFAPNHSLFFIKDSNMIAQLTFRT